MNKDILNLFIFKRLRRLLVKIIENSLTFDHSGFFYILFLKFSVNKLSDEQNNLPTHFLSFS